MTGLLELREKIKMIYSKNDVFILPVIKFLLAFVTLDAINGRMGYMTKLDNIAIVLIVALMCSFLPKGGIVFFAALFSLLHMYALSMEVAAVGLCLYMLMFLLFFRLSPKDTIVVVLTPLLCLFKIPYVMPVAMGLLGTPASAVAIGCGVAVYFLIATVVGAAPTISTMGTEEAAMKIRLIMDGILGNREMMVMIVAFAITVVVVYLIRRMSVNYSWTVAMIAGAMADLVILLVGDLLYDTNVSFINAILGSIATVAAAKVIEFFRFCVDYSRTEKVQFEDDEYYYYVKAIPKMTVSAPAKTVKKINTQHPGSRSVTTERTGSTRNAPYRDQSGYNRSQGSQRSGSRSVTINSRMVENAGEEYEELY